MPVVRRKKKGLANKVLAFDLDGTILRKDNTLHPETEKMLMEAKRFGSTNVIATGRGLLKVIPLINNGVLKYIDYLVCSNGALTFDLEKNETTILGSIGMDAFEAMLQKAKEEELIFSVDTDAFNGTIIFSNDGSELPSWLENETMDLAILNRFTEDQVRVALEEENASITQVAIRSPRNKAEKNTKEMQRILGDKYQVVLTNSVYTDVNKKGISKFQGLLYLCQQLNLKIEDVIAFGDSGNDTEMLTKCGIGIAMGNATKDAKQAADFVIGDHEDDAIGEAINYLIWNGVPIEVE